MEDKKIVSSDDKGTQASQQDENNLSAIYASMYKGPLPPPSVLIKYNESVANGSERLFVLFEKQTNHRIDMEKKIVENDIFLQRFGQIIGATLAFSLLLGLLISIWFKSSLGVLSSSSALIVFMVIIGYFVKGSSKQKNSEKR